MGSEGKNRPGREKRKAQATSRVESDVRMAEAGSGCGTKCEKMDRMLMKTAQDNTHSTRKTRHDKVPSSFI